MFLLLGVLPCAMDQGQVPEPTIFSQRVRRPHYHHPHTQLCFLYGTDEDANTRVPPPPMRKSPPDDPLFRTTQPKSTQQQFVVTYSGFTARARVAFQYAVDIWASLIRSPVPIRIEASFRYLDDFLALGGTEDWIWLESSNLWYPYALADTVTGRDERNSETDIVVHFDSSRATNWYFGTDGNTPSGRYDFVTTALHEIGHGLGFLGFAYIDVNKGALRYDEPLVPSIYDTFVENGDGTGITTFNDPSVQLLRQFTSDDLFWNGEKGIAGGNGTRPKIYAPHQWSEGSSYSHLREATYPPSNPDSLMTPIINSAAAVHNPGPITLGMLEDMGWTINKAPVFAVDTAIHLVTENTEVGVNIGSPVAATDAEDDTLTYSLRGNYAASFSIESTTGQLKTLAALNYETKRNYRVTLVVDDDRLEDTIAVTIKVTDVNDAPTFTTNTTTRSIREGTPANRNIGTPVSATDEDADTLTYTLDGTDAASFSLNSMNGRLKTKVPLNHEIKNIYEVTVTATDTENLANTISVTINVIAPVVFSDAGLEAAVRSALGIGSGTTIFPDMLAAFTSLTAAGDSITDLTGLEHATGLERLDLGDNEIVNLSPLSGLTNLTSLDLADNRIVNLTPLRNLTNLTNLDLDGNQIQDVFALPDLSNLETLDLQDNNVMDVTPLSTMPHLTHLYLRGNDNLTNIKHLVKLTSTTIDIDLPDPVEILDTNLAAALRTALSLPTNDPIFSENMETLTTFIASNHSIVTLTGLETATSLMNLTLSNNAIVNLSPLKNLVSLETLDLSDNAIVSLSDLSGLNALTTLNLSNNSITKVSPLANLTNLTRLDLSGNSGITNPGALYRLKQGGTTIIGVDVPDTVAFADANLETAVKQVLRLAATDSISPNVMATLTTLTATRKQITSLSGLEAATVLERLDVGDNQIVDLSPLSDLTRLEILDLADNQIINMSLLRNLTNLTNLDLDGNQIQNISSLPSLSSLETLDLTYNNVGDVTPLSTMTHLKYLYLRGNENLTNLKQLVKLKEAGTRVDITLPSPVNIPNDNLKDALQTALGLQTDAPIFPEDMETLTTFNASNHSIITLTGLETATNLTTLNLSNNQISSISPLSRLTKLESLDLADNTISSISSLSALTFLTDLNLSNNQISSVSSLSRLTSLETLNLSDNRISSLSTLSKLTSLTELDLSNNQIRDVLALQGLSLLRRLNLDGNTNLTQEKAAVLYKLQQSGTTITLPQGITLPTTADIVVFNNTALETAVRSALRITTGYPILTSEITELTNLTATRKQIDDLTGLEDVTGLTRLDLGNNEIVDLAPLQNLTSLTNLDLADNQIVDVSLLRNLMNLTNLDLDGNQIQNVSNLSSLSSLETLDLTYNDVIDVTPLSTMTHLRYLYLRYNENLSNIKQLVKLKEAGTRVDITLPSPVNIPNDNLKDALQTALGLQTDDPIFPEDMETLTTFNASNRSITTLTGLEKATTLNTLNLSNNQISSISPLSRLTSLESLNLSENQISSISSLSGLTALTSLNLSNNRISSISSLWRLSNLTTLNLSMNQIRSLSSLSGLSTLTDLELSGNHITDVLSLQGLSNLRRLDLSGNTGLTQEKAAVLYKLDQGGTTITLPQGITLPTATDIVVFNNAALESAVRSALRIATGYPILTSKITELTSLTATRKAIDDLTGLEQATGLTRLDLGDNEIVTLGPLSGLTSLTNLDLADNQIEVLSPLSGLSYLESLDLDDNEIEDVSALSNLTNLRTLDLGDNDVMDVSPLKDLTSLTYIYLRGNENLTNLEWLGALENLRSDIRLPDVVRIPDTNLDAAVRTALRTAGNTVSNDLPMSEDLLESLETLTASNRGIADLRGCEHMTALTSLDLRNNQITDVTPLSKLYSLVTLKLAGNTILDTSSLVPLTRRNLTDVDIEISPYPSWDVNRDGNVDETDLFLVTLTITGESPDVNGDGNINTDDETAADANKDGRVDTDDLLLVLEKFDRPVNLAAPLLSAKSAGWDWKLLERIDAGRLRVHLDILQVENDGTLKYQQAIAFLQEILTALQPNQTLLLANYPNPFNPETWIPYQLATGSDVRITIYDPRGAIVRRLALGYRAEGYYRVRSRAAHWDGRNDVREPVASGVYFYQLKTDKVSLLRKMVILK